MLLILFLIIAFLLGSIPFSYVLGKQVKGIDLRQHGSGNLGSTNVFRLLGPGWGALCLALDMGKGAAAVVLVGLAFWWSVRSGQYDDLEGPAHRIVDDDDDPVQRDSR